MLVFILLEWAAASKNNGEGFETLILAQIWQVDKVEMTLFCDKEIIK